MKAFVLRIAHVDADGVGEALRSDEVFTGWSRARGLLDPRHDWRSFREIVHTEYHSGQQDYAQSGRAAGSLWRFIREMDIGDLVVVPSGNAFHVAKVTGPARHDEGKVADDAAHRRPVKWLNDGKPIPRRFARAALQSRMKVRQTCADATDLVAEIEDVLLFGTGTEPPT